MLENITATQAVQRPSFKLRRLWLATGLLLLTGIAYYFGFHPVAKVEFNDLVTGQQLRTGWVWLDYVTSHNKLGHFDGVVRKPASGDLWLDNTTGATVRLTVSGKQIYQGTNSFRIALDNNSPTLIPFTIDYKLTSDFPPDGHLALMQDGMFGSHTLVPAWQFTHDPGPDIAGNVIRFLCLIAGLATIIVFLSSIRLSRRGWIGLAIILLIALSVRLISLNEKFMNDPGEWTMANIWDNYMLMGRRWVGGSQGVGGTVFQQGTFVYLGFLQMAIGPQLNGQYLFNTVIGSLCAGFAMLTGWMLFDEATGYVAGIIIALFAPLIHYQQTLQDVAPVILIVSGLLFILVGFYRQPNLVFIILYGVLIGIGTAFRNTIALLIIIPFVLIFIQNRPWKTHWRRLAGYEAVLLILPALCIAPITIANFRAGTRALTANLADYQLFRSNNLNSSGMNTFMTQSEQLAMERGETWSQATLREVARDPGRVVQLTIRRIALFWDAHEHSDSAMIDYQTTGLDVSPTLRLLSLNDFINFRTLMCLALVGLGLGLFAASTRRETLILAGAAFLFIAPLAAFYVIGRVRAPLTDITALLDAVGLVAVWRILRQPRPQVSLWKRYRVAAAVVVLALVLTDGFNVLAANLPRPELVSQPPQDTVAAQGTYNGELQLLGYAYYLSNDRAGGYLSFELFWKALVKPAQDYVASFRLINNTTKADVDIQNFMLGTLTTPEWTDTNWNPGDIYDERYLLKVPDDKDVSSYDIYVGLYDQAKGQLLPVTDPNVPVLDNHVRLTGLGIGKAQHVTATPNLVTWGQALGLNNYTCEANDQGITLNLDWQVLQRPTKAVTMFAHVFKDGTLVAQHDATPDENTPTDAWLPGVTRATAWQFPGVTGPVTVDVGFYDFSNQRWAITNKGQASVANDTVTLTCPSTGNSVQQ